MRKYITLFVLLINFAVYGVEFSPVNIMSLRQMSMGGVSVTTSEDDHALNQNPASLTNIDSFRLKVLYLNAGGNTKGIDLVKDITSLSSSATQSDQLSVVRRYVPSKIDYSFSISPILSMSWKGFGLGMYTSTKVNGLIGNLAQPVLKLSGGVDNVFGLGFAKELSYRNWTYDFGIAVKYVAKGILYSKSTGKDIYEKNVADLLSSSNDDSTGDVDMYFVSGPAIDLGIKSDYTFMDYTGSYGFSFKNVYSSLSGTQISESGGVETEQNVSGKLPFNASFGFSIDDEFVGVGQLLVAMDYRFISHVSNFRKNLFMGVEKKLFNGILSLRGGLHHGFIVGGFGLNFKIFHLDYAMFGEEFGEKIGHDGRVSQHFKIAFMY